MTYRARACAAIALLLIPLVAAHAQTSTAVRPTIETLASGSEVSDGYGNWRSVSARAAWQIDDRTVLFPEVSAAEQFHDRGTLFALSAAHVVDEAWYAFGAISTSAGGFFLPRARGVAVLNRKLLPSRRLVVNAGGSYAKWKDAHSDAGISAGAAYYFDAPVVLESGTNRNFSQPGNAQSQSYFAAVTEGRAGEHYLVIRASGGREAYQVLALGQPITDFSSRSGSVTWRQWLTPSGGVVIGVERYTNAFYRRNGLTAGAFWKIE